ncbi:MAG: alpha/beta fold hydrolase [Planctomycetota bacterium]
MEERFARLPTHLRARTLITDLPGPVEPVPTLLAHPEESWWEPGATPAPAPLCLWMHGRTAFKELDPGRYLRWVRAGIGACSIDLPGHGARQKPGWDRTENTIEVVEQASREIDTVLDALRDAKFNNAFDLERVAIGGMSAGGMVALNRLTRAHGFTCTSLEATAGNFEAMRGTPLFSEEKAERLSPVKHLDDWRPVPLLAVHSEADESVPVEAMRTFIEPLRAHYAAHNADPDSIRFHTWERTGAPYEHDGFGSKSNEAKNMQTEFLAQHLRAEAPA